MKLILICGPPGVGKLTVAKVLELSTKFKLLHNHLVVDLVAEIFGRVNPVADELNIGVRKLIYEIAAKHNLPGLIATFVYRGEQYDEALRGFMEVVQRYNGEAFFVRLFCEKKSLEERIANPSRLGTKKITELEKLEEEIEMRNAAALLSQESIPNIAIDNTHLSPEQVVMMIRAYCRI